MLKCIVFAIVVFHVTFLHASVSLPPKSRSCGQRYLDASGSKESNESYVGEFPWMVAVMTDRFGLIEYMCGGSLIHPKMVLTAAQCIKSIEASQVMLHSERMASDLIVRVGEWDLRTTTEDLPHKDRNVSRIIVHESANHPLDKGEFNDIEDFALLILQEGVAIDLNVQTICLPDPGIKFDKRHCFVSGWSERIHGKLQRFEQSIVDHDTCEKNLRGTFLGENLLLSRRFICAGKALDFFCHSFEGGPLVCPLSDDPTRYVQIGIFSWPISCGALSIPNLYGNVSRMRTWIEQHMKEVDNLSNENAITSFFPSGCGQHHPDAGWKNGILKWRHLNEFPWSVKILNKKHSNQECTGSLIHQQVVLTTSHCIKKFEAPMLKIRAGKWDPMMNNSFHFQDQNISRMVIRENNNNNNKSLMIDTIALLFLESPFNISENINTICLPNPGTLYDESHCFISGWKNDFSSTSKRVNIPIVNHQKCEKYFKAYFGNIFNLDGSSICAGSGNGQDSCNSYPGTALICPPKKKGVGLLQVGSMSLGMACGTTKVPELFRDIVGERLWIDRQMRNSNLDTSSYVDAFEEKKEDDIENTLYIITSTYRRPGQIPEITKLSQTLMLVKDIHWLVIEDEKVPTPQVTQLLHKSKLRFNHFTAQMPDRYKNSKLSYELRHVTALNWGLKWIRKYATGGVVYFAMENYNYDIDLFKEIKATKKVSMFPVGYETNLGVSSPIIRNGIFEGFYDGWKVGRKYPVSMPGFAVSVEFLWQRPKAEIPLTPGFREDGFLRSLEPLGTGDIQYLADKCTQILVWNTLAVRNYSAPPLDIKLYEGTNVIELRRQIV